MEGLVIVLGVCALIFLLLKSGRKRDAKPQKKLPEPAFTTTIRSQTPQKRKPPQPFKTEGATHLDKPQVIEGRARIVDGDTIVINKTQIRLFGIDAPEIDHPYGKKAKWALVSLCKGHTVRTEITDVDSYGRTVGKCYLPDGRDLSAEMVKQGLAIDWPKFSGGAYEALETEGVRKKLWLADARQKGRMHVWEQFDYDAYRARRGQGEA